jgi:hypothetical protein
MAKLVIANRQRTTGNWFSGMLPQMWGFRWSARFLLLVMLAPVYEPLAMARAYQPGPMHCCQRKSLSAGSARPAMPCHHGMAEAAQSESFTVEVSEPSVAATNGKECCQNHCCCGATTSEWAQPAFHLLSVLHLLIEPARLSYNAELHTANISGHDSARAPPRSWPKTL